MDFGSYMTERKFSRAEITAALLGATMEVQDKVTALPEANETQKKITEIIAGLVSQYTVENLIRIEQAKTDHVEQQQPAMSL